MMDLAPLWFGDISLDMFAAFMAERYVFKLRMMLTTYLVQIFDNMNDIQSHSVSNWKYTFLQSYFYYISQFD